ncbi:hypothetical protein BD779DRAFT_943938 [Infundibulicybe gibba]|nr:hypothetical protein BD779DRAFT_943938 [Infundibulicybe gibba]
MTGFLSLPIDLVQEMSKNLPITTKRVLRLVCQQLNYMLEPSVFSHLVINVNKHRIDAPIAQLTALATGQTRAGGFVRSLNIVCLAPSHDPKRSHGSQKCNTIPEEARRAAKAERALERYLAPALAALRHVQSVRWVMSRRDSLWTWNTVMNYVYSGLEFLETVHFSDVSIAAPVHMTRRMFGLRELVVATCLRPCDMDTLRTIISLNPGLRHLDITHKPAELIGSLPCLNELLTLTSTGQPLQLDHLGLDGISVQIDANILPHLRTLRSLKLLHQGSPENTDAIMIGTMFGDPSSHLAASHATLFDALRTAEIHVTHLALSHAIDGLPEYLASYAGLRSLELMYPHTSAGIGNGDDAAAFFRTALWPHFHTLERLAVRPLCEDTWCFGAHIEEALSKCVGLRSMAFGIGSGIDIAGEVPQYLDVDRYLRVATRLPHLEEAMILPAEFNRLWDYPLAQPADHTQMVSARISKFNPPAGVAVDQPLIVTSGTRRYMLARSCGEQAA